MSELRLALGLAKAGPVDWAWVERVREAVDRCVALVHGDDDEARDAIAMAAAELMENAVKYGRVEGNEIALSLSEEEGAIAIEVASRPAEGEIDATLATIDAQIGEIAAFPSPAEAYAALLARVPAHDAAPEAPARSGLGLVRIAYEGGFALSARRQDDRVIVRAARAR